ncbi:amino acid ABC transporter substrate-binding protein [Streptomyces sp. CC53]|uniref:ABC transporter substrate-binding protein n=1 Tax=unclassified Streptomyces TaxID=2593676 RepID=UPI0008DE6242|nr:MULTISPECIES: ABC transporter substrate-binding protein [unclassified Streptomyces]OII60120.1 amino acid ABC transporter substrate-binding protein [Streptomyces sp. CC53]
MRAALTVAVLLPLLLVAACGSRLPESDFGPRGDASRAPVRVGIITSATSPVGGEAFVGPREGALAYFADLNADGGLDGRPVEVLTCDDGGSGVGNNACFTELVRERGVFALVATTSLDYAAARRVSAAGVPDIGGQPITPAYDTYPHLYSIYGSSAPRTGAAPGWNGVLYGGTEVYRYFKERLGARTAGVVAYNQSASAAYAGLIARGLETEGYRVVRETVDFALPNWRAAAADLRAQGADVVFDALDSHGNARLCEALDAVGATLTAKVTNVQNWNSAVPRDYADAPRCRNALWVTGSSRNHDDLAHPAVRAFREAMDTYREGTSLRSQWQLEGWAAAMWFTDAARSCLDGGAGDLTRDCVERFLNRDEPYTADGLLLPARFRHLAEPPATRRACLSVARWRDGSGWVTQGEMTENCATVPQLGYRP